MSEQNQTIPFNKIIDALLDDDSEFPVTYISEFSDINPKNLSNLKQIWNQVTPQRKIHLFETLELVFETQYTQDFSDIAALGLADQNSAVRVSSVRLLDDNLSWQYIAPLINLLNNDTEIEVRAEAARAMGKYVYAGELDEIPEEDSNQVQDALIKVLKSEDGELVRQKALESLGFSGREEVDSMISNAYMAADNNWISSALIAMGRSADEKWGDKILKAIINPNLHIQNIAILAAGELELQPARKLLLNLLAQDGLDEEIWVSTIWSLSKIGGEDLEPIFEQLLEDSEDEETTLFLEEALENLQLTNGIMMNMDLFGLPDVDEDALREYSIDDEQVELEAFEQSWLDILEKNLEAQLDEDEEPEE